MQQETIFNIIGENLKQKKCLDLTKYYTNIHKKCTTWI